MQISPFAGGQKIFRRYTLQKVLGQGGMGVVWLARDEQLESLVALKVLPESLSADAAALDSLKSETKMGRSLAHPNIVRIFDFQQDENLAAISMEYVDGGNLSDLRIRQPNKIFEPADLRDYLNALCDGLDYAHTRERIVHRDLKPRNLMVTSRGELKIADFGISKSIAESMTLLTGMLGSSGSPPYTSPQQWDGERPTPLDDIYSVGATLYELLTGKPPLLGVIDSHRIHNSVPPPIAQRRLDLGIQGAKPVPAEWEEAIAACLAKNPRERPQSVAELHSRLGGRPLPSRVPPAQAAGANISQGLQNPVAGPGSDNDFDVTIVRSGPIRVSDIAAARAAGGASDDSYDVTIVRNAPPARELPGAESSADPYDVTILRATPPVRESGVSPPAVASDDRTLPAAAADHGNAIEPAPAIARLESPPAETRPAAARVSPEEAAPPPSAPGTRRVGLPGWTWAACAAVILVAGSILLMRPRSPHQAVAAPPPASLTVQSPPPIVPTPRPAPPTAGMRLSIRSDPPGASIRLDGAPPDQPPGIFTNVKFGGHQATATLDGYEPKQLALRVTPGMGAEVILKLNRMPATPAPDPIAAAERVLAKYDPTDDASGFLNASMQLVGLLTTGGEPASPEHVKLLDHVLTGLRNKAPVLGGDEFSDYKDNFLVAAHRDILPAILVMADNLKAANSTEAFGWYYYAAAVKHDSYAMRSLAWLYWLGECGVKPDKQTGFNWFKQAYVAGDTMAGAILGNCYLRGDGTARDEDAGISVLLPLANDGVADAQTLIGECYYYGYGQFGALTQDERNRKAIEFFKDAIAGKDWAACGHLGVLYETGEGVPKDWKEAARLYLQGVNNQNPVCMYYYARAIETHGAEISKVFGRNDNAESYYRMAAAAGIADARAWCMEHKVQF